MNYLEALKEAADGKKIRLPDWSSEEYLAFSIDLHQPLQFYPASKRAFSYRSEILREDWEIYEEKKSVTLDTVKSMLLRALAESSILKTVGADPNLCPFYRSLESQWERLDD